MAIYRAYTFYQHPGRFGVNKVYNSAHIEDEVGVLPEAYNLHLLGRECFHKPR